MNATSSLLAAFALFGLSACWTSPTPLQKDPEVEKDFANRREEAARQEANRQEFRSVLLRLDPTLSSYAREISEKGNPRADKRAVSIQSFLQKTVDKHFESLLGVANGAGTPGDRAVALAALGFASGPEALSTLAAGASSPDPFIANAAVFGLAEKRDPKTPPKILTAIITDDRRETNYRIHAAWALERVQQSLYDPSFVVQFWRELLDQPMGDVHAGILKNAIRGVGRRRNPKDTERVAKFASHPTPAVRFASAIAMGRIRDRGGLEALLALIGPGETNDNVRLAARKGLQAIAGGDDFEYDAKQWQRALNFEPSDTNRSGNQTPTVPPDTMPTEASGATEDGE